MSNYRETNFNADLGGFHSFRFTLVWGAELVDSNNALRRLYSVYDRVEVLRHAE